MKKIFFLLLPLFLFADIKFASSASFDDETKRFALNACDVIEKEFDITLTKNTQSDIYVDEAALYALKNGLIKFTIVRKKLFEELGLEFGEARSYGLEPLFTNNEIVLIGESRFVATISQAKKISLQKQLKNLKN